MTFYDAWKALEWKENDYSVQQRLMYTITMKKIDESRRETDVKKTRALYA